MAEDTTNTSAETDEPVEPPQDPKKDPSVPPTGWDPYSPPPAPGNG